MFKKIAIITLLAVATPLSPAQLVPGQNEFTLETNIKIDDTMAARWLTLKDQLEAIVDDNLSLRYALYDIIDDSDIVSLEAKSLLNWNMQDMKAANALLIRILQEIEKHMLPMKTPDMLLLSQKLRTIRREYETLLKLGIDEFGKQANSKSPHIVGLAASFENGKSMKVTSSISMHNDLVLLVRKHSDIAQKIMQFKYSIPQEHTLDSLQIIGASYKCVLMHTQEILNLLKKRNLTPEERTLVLAQEKIIATNMADADTIIESFKKVDAVMNKGK